jgi:SAM-dependent methyltransferase
MSRSNSPIIQTLKGKYRARSQNNSPVQLTIKNGSKSASNSPSIVRRKLNWRVSENKSCDELPSLFKSISDELENTPKQETPRSLFIEDEYFPLTSDKQILILFRRHPGWIHNIFSKVLYKYLSEKEVTDFLDKIVPDATSDKAVYQAVQQKITQVECSSWDEHKPLTPSNRSASRVRDISRFYTGKLASADKYLDLGGGDGSITSAIGKWLNRSPKQIICADLSWFDEGRTSIEDITYTNLVPDKRLPFQAREFALITCFQSLHHMTNLRERIEDIYYSMAKKGILIIREHDCVNADNRMLIDIEHGIFELVLKNLQSTEYNQAFIDSYYATYYSRTVWSNMLKEVGFKYIPADYPVRYGKYNPTRYYYAMYIKN